MLRASSLFKGWHWKIHILSLKAKVSKKCSKHFYFFFPEKEKERNCICIWVFPTICSLLGTVAQHTLNLPSMLGFLFIFRPSYAWASWPCAASPICWWSWFSCFHGKQQWDVTRGSSFLSQWDADKNRCRCHVLRYLPASLCPMTCPTSTIMGFTIMKPLS